MAATAEQPRTPTGRTAWIMVALLLACNLLASLMQSIMNVALDDVATRYHISLSVANWVVLGYAIVTGTVITMGASLLKRFGLRIIMMAGCVFALAGSLLGFFAWDFPSLLAGRLIQAVCTGLYFPIVNEALLTIAPKGKAGVLLSVNSCAIGAGLAFAPLVAGALIAAAGLQSLFLVTAIGATALLVLSFFFLRDIYARAKRPIDIPSVILSFLGLGALMYGLNEVTHSLVPSLALMAAGAAVMALFVWRQKRIAHPLLDLRPFKVRAFTIGEMLIVFSYMSSIYMSLLMPLYLEGTAGYSAFKAGLVLVAPILCYAAACLASGKILGKHGVWPLVPLGFALTLGAFIAMEATSAAQQIVPMLIAVAVAYGGIGLLYPAVKSVDLEVLPADISANGSAIHSTIVQLAGSVGSALYVGVMAGDVDSLMAAGTAKAAAYAAGFSHTLLMGIGVVAAALALSFLYARAVDRWSQRNAKTEN